jgi:hypothetical protein
MSSLRRKRVGAYSRRGGEAWVVGGWPTQRVGPVRRVGGGARSFVL